MFRNRASEFQLCGVHEGGCCYGACKDWLAGPCFFRLVLLRTGLPYHYSLALLVAGVGEVALWVLGRDGTGTCELGCVMNKMGAVMATAKTS